MFDKDSILKVSNLLRCEKKKTIDNTYIFKEIENFIPKMDLGLSKNDVLLLYIKLGNMLVEFDNKKNGYERAMEQYTPEVTDVMHHNCSHGDHDEPSSPPKKLVT